MGAVKYSESELKELYDIALREGWDQLEPSERIAVGRYCRKQGLDRPGLAPSVAKQPPVEAESVKPVEPKPEPILAGFETMPLVDGRGRKRKAAEPVKTGDDADLELLRSVRWLEDWPADITTKPLRPAGKWEKPAKAVRMGAGRVAVISEDMGRKPALNLRQRIIHGNITAFKPKGAYRVEIAPDHRHEGKWIVCAAYLGEPRKAVKAGR